MIPYSLKLRGKHHANTKPALLIAVATVRIVSFATKAAVIAETHTQDIVLGSGSLQTIVVAPAAGGYPSIADDDIDCDPETYDLKHRGQSVACLFPPGMEITVVARG